MDLADMEICTRSKTLSVAPTAKMMTTQLRNAAPMAVRLG
jgi:hypothetical protein